MLNSNLNNADAKSKKGSTGNPANPSEEANAGDAESNVNVGQGKEKGKK